MPRGGHNRKPAHLRALAGTLRPDRVYTEGPQLPALTRWPPAPKEFSESEKKAWKRLGKSLLPKNTISVADLIFVEYVARQMAFTEAALADPALPARNKNSLLKALRESFAALGLTPAARRNVQALPGEDDDVGEDPDDPLASMECPQ